MFGLENGGETLIFMSHYFNEKMNNLILHLLFWCAKTFNLCLLCVKNK